MENDVRSLQLGDETNRKPRDSRSPSNHRGQALREGHVVDGSGCDSWIERFLGTPVEEGVEARKQATVQASSGQISQVVGPSADRIGRCVGTGNTVLGLRAGWMDRPFSRGHDPAIVRCRVSSGICAAFVASAWLESAEARAASPRTQRGGHRPLASRILAATKKRASTVKLAWFFWTKVGFCCSHCGGESGRRSATRPSSVPGIAAIALRRLPRSPAPPGRCGWGCTTNFWITMRARTISFDSCAKFMDICVVQSFWFGIACLLIVQPRDDYLMTITLGFRWNGSRRTHRTLILWRMFGAKPSTGPWQTSFQKTSTICTPPWITFWTPFGTSPTVYIRSLTQLI